MSKKQTNSKIISKREAQELLSDQLRNPKLESELLVKVMSAYIKIAGWDEDKNKEPNEEVDMDKLVAAVEKKRKSNA